MNCIDDECWLLEDKTVRDTDKMRCMFTGRPIDAYNIKNCPHYKEIQSCPTCVHSILEGATGGSALDGVMYKCELQGYKVVYQDVHPLNCDYASVPECPIGKYSKERQRTVIGTFSQYRGHVGSIEICDNDSKLYGVILDVRRDNIQYEAGTIQGLFRQFKKVVDNYEAWGPLPLPRTLKNKKFKGFL